jgi:hypothetical protein
MAKKIEKITFDMSRELKAEIKIHATRRFMTMKAWMEQAIGKAILEEREFEIEEDDG